MRQIYLDHAAATPIDTAVLAAMKPYFSTEFYNPSALYLASKKVASDIDTARSDIAKCLGARPSEVIFTAGGTEANNLAVHGIMKQYPEANLIVSAIEHESILEPAKEYSHKFVPVDSAGIVDLQAIEKLIDDKTVLVSVMYANNEIGTIQPISEVSKVVKKILTSRQKTGNTLPLYLHTDACQAAACLDIHVNRLGVDLMTLNAGKIYGPKQCGGLYVQSKVEIIPLIRGGGQERNLRSGTENVPSVIGFAAALNLIQINRHQEAQRLKSLQQLFLSLIENKLPRVIVNGSIKHRLPNNVHLTVPGYDNERLLMQLDELGIQCAVGSACSASQDEPSHVLKAIGLTDTEAQSSLRFTMGHSTTEAAIRYTVRSLASCL